MGMPLQMSLRPPGAMQCGLEFNQSIMPDFDPQFNEVNSPLKDAGYPLSSYFGRIHRKYKDMDTSNIENIVNRSLQEQNSALNRVEKKKNQNFINFVRKNTYRSDSIFYWILGVKTYLGEVLQELQDSQESPNRNLLPKKTFIEAVKEAEELNAIAAFIDQNPGVSAGLSVSTLNNRGISPLYRACEKGDIKIAELLLKHGADPIQRNTWPYLEVDIKNAIPMGAAMKTGRVDLVKLLINPCSLLKHKKSYFFNFSRKGKKLKTNDLHLAEPLELRL